MSKDIKNILIIFAKAPDYSLSKTRLKKDIASNQLATQLQEAFLLDIQEAVKASRVFSSVYLFVYPYISSFFVNNFNELIVIKEQRGEFFSARIHKAVKEVQLIEGQEINLLLIGSDCPFISSNIFKQAADCLSQGKSVIGASQRGGYYSLGSSASAISRLSFSFNDAFDVLNIAKELNSSIELLPFLPDIDYKDDLITCYCYASLLKKRGGEYPKNTYLVLEKEYINQGIS